MDERQKYYTERRVIKSSQPERLWNDVLILDVVSLRMVEQ
jgi:hypothetical protein